MNRLNSLLRVYICACTLSYGRDIKVVALKHASRYYRDVIRDALAMYVSIQ